MDKAQEYKIFMQHKNHCYYYKINSSVANQKATITIMKWQSSKKQFTQYDRLHKSQIYQSKSNF